YRFVGRITVLSDDSVQSAQPESADDPGALPNARTADVLDGPGVPATRAPLPFAHDLLRVRSLWLAVLLGASAIAGGLLTTFLARTPIPTPPLAIRFTIAPPEGTTFSPSASLLAVSPDGRFVAFLAARAGQDRRLWV